MAGDPPIPFGPGSPGYGPGGEKPEEEPRGPQSPIEPESAPEPPPAPTPPPTPPPQASPPAPTPTDPFTSPPPPGGWDRPLGRAPKPPPPEADRLATWGSRFVAQIIDWLVILVPGGIVGLLAVGAIFGDGDDVGTGTAIGMIALLLFCWLVVGMFYGPVVMCRRGRRNGQTWGKQALGITVTRDSGEQFGFWAAAGREIGLKGFAVGFACFVIPVIPFFVDYLWPLGDKQNRAVHDIAAETHVVKL
jgi:uncharacterized RDD family membrane protein YckC